MGKGKFILGLVIGLICAVAIFCAVVGIAGAINNLTFGEQIVEWFGTATETITEVADTVTETTM